MSVEDRAEAEQLLRRAGKNTTVHPFSGLLMAVEQGNVATVASYLSMTGIPVSSPLGQSLMRLSSGGPAYAPVQEEIDAPELRPLRAGELLVMGSRFKRCGIREYEVNLNSELAKLGRSVCSVRLQDVSVLRSARNADVLLHIEPALLPAAFDGELAGALSRGCRIVMCMHSLNSGLLRRFGDLASAIVAHRDYGILHPKMKQIPLGCPIYETRSSVADLREKYKLPEDATVITTFGFLTAWKRFPETARALVPLLQPNMFLQMLCTPHFQRFVTGEQELRVAVRGSSQVQLQLSYLPQQELNERLYASDLGFVYHGQNTGSVSAAARQFITSRCPLVVTSSSHTSDLKHASRPDQPDLDGFVQHLLRVASDKKAISTLREATERVYEQINMRTVAEQYRDLFASLKES